MRTPYTGFVAPCGEFGSFAMSEFDVPVPHSLTHGCSLALSLCMYVFFFSRVVWYFLCTAVLNYEVDDTRVRASD